MRRPGRRDQPHDLVFRRVFSRVEHARSALRMLVGPTVAERLDWPALQLEPGSYVETKLRGSMSDLLFSVPMRSTHDPALVYLLWDHQRRPQRLMPLRMLGYGHQAVRGYTERSDAIPGYVPPLVPVVVYQGTGRWPGPHRLSGLAHRPGTPAMPAFMELEMIVHELRHDSLPADELTTLAKTTFRLLRLAALEQIVSANARLLSKWLNEVHLVHGFDDYRSLLEYILRTTKDDTMSHSIIEHTHEDLKPEAMSCADMLEAKGRANGWAEAMAKGQTEKRVMLLEMLEHRFGPLPTDVRSRVSVACGADVRRWVLRLLDAASLPDVFDPA